LLTSGCKFHYSWTTASV